VTVPKRTGRKRKRGTSGPFLAEEEIEGNANANAPRASQNYTDASTVFKSLQDNVSNYEVSVAGVVDETHRFRSQYLSPFETVCY
jgi:general transcription factor 3C polypeptide 5 (transcription factor C subunit 1)